MRPHGAEGVEALGAVEERLGLLDVPGGDVVERGVAKDIGAHIVALAEVHAAPRQDHGELAFVLDLLGIARQDDGLVRPDDGRRGLEKEERLFGRFVAQLGNVRRVVAPNADYLAGFDGRQQAHVAEPPGARAAGPWPPRRPADLPDLLPLEQAVDARGGT